MSDIKKDLVGKQVLGVKFDSTEDLNYLNEMDDYVGVAGEVLRYLSYLDAHVVQFFNSLDSTYYYPAELLKEVTDSETNVSTNLCKESVVEDTPVELKLEVGKSYVEDPQNDSENTLTEYMKNVWGDELEKKEDVTNPSHYTDGNIEVIDFIEDKNLGFHLGNAVKYIARMGKKDIANPKDDARKAIWYIERYIATQLKD